MWHTCEITSAYRLGVTLALMKLEKAQEFLIVADVAVGSDLWDAGTSSAVLAGINAADALTLEFVGRYPKRKNHEDILSLLRQCGGRGGAVVRHLRPLLAAKTKAQYAAARCTRREAEAALRHAKRAYDLVAQLVPKGS